MVIIIETFHTYLIGKNNFQSLVVPFAYKTDIYNVLYANGTTFLFIT